MLVNSVVMPGILPQSSPSMLAKDQQMFTKALRQRNEVKAERITTYSDESGQGHILAHLAGEPLLRVHHRGLHVEV